jgi:cardiolipin synthase C
MSAAGASGLGRAIAPLVAAHPGHCGIHPLRDPQEAFAARALLAAAAEHTLDVQCYIWHADVSGTLLFDALRAAADRGVQIRLLLDDANTAGLDPILLVLDQHPRIAVRLFNPFRSRRWRWLDYVTNLARVNRRMHNKSFTIDGQVTIVGGRNIGDEYFGVPEAVDFEDLDVIAVGPVVREVCSAFDRYWESESAVPIESVLRRPPVAKRGIGLPVVLNDRQQAISREYAQAMGRSSFARDLENGRLGFEWAPTRLWVDPPLKGMGRAAARQLVSRQLRELFGESASHVDLVSPYFVPGRWGAKYLATLARRGNRIRVLTNALESTDVLAAHAGYAKYRRRLLSAGVKLYELKRSPAAPVVARELRGDAHPRTGLPGSSRSSLHAKTFAIDGARVFVGSLNFDPRSAKLNTEMGLVIDCPALAQRVSTVFDEHVPFRAYEVVLTHGRMNWLERKDGLTVDHEREPGATLWQRFLVRIYSALPIESLL